MNAGDEARFLSLTLALFFCAVYESTHSTSPTSMSSTETPRSFCVVAKVSFPSSIKVVKYQPATNRGTMSLGPGAVEL